MKKIILIIAALLALCSCSPKTQVEKKFEDGTRLYARRFVFEGRQYIEFLRIELQMYDNYTGFVHDPDCPCKEKTK